VLVGVAALLSSQTATFAEPSLSGRSTDPQSSLLRVAKKSVIDKSCIMMCDQ